jgi:pre-mRNA-splicing factor 18
LKVLEGEDKEEIRAFINKIKERNLDPNTALVPVF